MSQGYEDQAQPKKTAQDAGWHVSRYNINVTWFGGEPLLAPDIIEALSVRLMVLAEEKGCRYGVSRSSLFRPPTIGIQRARQQIRKKEASRNYDA